MNYGKKVYIETIEHKGTLVAVGSVHSSLRKAKAFVQRLIDEREVDETFQNEDGSFGVIYHACGFEIKVTITEHIIF